MNNKGLGTKFEHTFVNKMAKNGWWVHFLAPNAGGAQPFDIFAFRGDDVYAIDCKTCAGDSFSLRRIEDNQMNAFFSLTWKSAIVRCGLAVIHDGVIYYISFSEIVKAIHEGRKSIKLTEEMAKDARNRFERNTN